MPTTIPIPEGTPQWAIDAIKILIGVAAILSFILLVLVPLLRRYGPVIQDGLQWMLGIKKQFKALSRATDVTDQEPTPEDKELMNKMAQHTIDELPGDK